MVVCTDSYAQLSTHVFRLIVKSVLILNILFGCIHINAKTWIAIDHDSTQCVTTHVIESSTSCYRIQIKTHGLYNNVIQEGGNEYHQLSFEDGESLCHTGEPDLPVYSQLIAIPDNVSCKAIISNEKWTTLDIGAVYPAQELIKGTEERKTFELNRNIYGLADYTPHKLTISETMNWRGIDYVGILICPFIYHPLSGKLEVMTDFTMEIHFTEQGISQKRSPRLPINERDGNRFSNSNILSLIGAISADNMPRSSSDNYDYLIIAGNITGVTTCQTIKDFMQWKADKGLKTKIVSTNTIGTTDTSIKNYIIQESSKGIRYVLFIGDDDKIPLHTKQISSTESAKSDYWYGCLGGESDDIADVAIGRFSTNDLTELKNMVDKTIKYESMSKPYLDRVLLVAHHEDASSSLSFQSFLEDIRTSYYQTPMSFSKCYGALTYYGGTNATNDTLLQDINRGYNIINYQGHGLYDRWNYWSYNYDSFTTGNISTINDSICSVFFSLACLTGDIRNQTCLMEAMMRMDHGAAAYLGATESVYTGINSTFNKRLFKELLDNSTYHLGDVINNANAYLLNNPSNHFYYRDQLNAYSYICCGDPSLEIWTGVPQTFGNISFSVNGNNINIDSAGISNYDYAVVDEDGELIETGITTNGTCTVSKPTIRKYIVLNKHNYVPCVIQIDASESYIQNKTFDHSALYLNSTYQIGYDVKTDDPYGYVIVKPGNTLKITTNNSVNIKNGFECKKGAVLEIKCE